MRLIDADRIKETHTKDGNWDLHKILDSAPTVQAIPITDNATNGDVIKTMFPNASIHYHKANELIDDYVSVNIIGCDTQQDYSADWWNAPYKGSNAE